MSLAPDAEAPASPTIDPVPEGADRPFWSVMIPCYDAGDDLEQALRSVLDQDPGPDRMQVAVVDDASPGADRAEAIARRLAAGRVEFHRNGENLGLAGNWNRCIGLARGRWVHLLHQDDWVLPGFYERLGRAEAAGAWAACCRHVFADWDGHWDCLSEVVRRDAGVAGDLLGRLSSCQCIQCAAMAVRRSSYEALGGFRRDLRYTLDWEMWCRVAAAGPVWYDPRLMACYRRHEASETAALRRSDGLLPDIRRAIPIIRGLVPEALRPGVGRGQLGWLRFELGAEADRAVVAGDHRAAMDRLRQAMACDPRPWWRPRWSLDLRRRQLRALRLAAAQAVGLSPRPAGAVPEGVRR